MSPARKTLSWAVLAIVITVPIAAAAASPLHAWRDPVYIAAGFAGIIAMIFLLLQPLLIGGYLPGLSGLRGRRVHHIIGGALVMAVTLHVAGLWITSPPDVVDALLFASPTPFSDAPAAASVAAANLAALPYGSCGCDRPVQRGACPSDRRDNGDNVEGRALHSGCSGGSEIGRRPARLELAAAVEDVSGSIFRRSFSAHTYWI